MKHTLLSHTLASFGLRRQVVLLDSQRLQGQGVLAAESLSRWASQSGPWHLLRDRHKGEEIMQKHIFNVHSFCWVNGKAPADEVTGISSDDDILWEGKCACPDFLVCLLDIA